jgi:hypothetical protein
MHWTVYLYHEAFLHTVEVYDERSHRVLAPELSALQLSIAECLPKQRFARRRLFAKAACGLSHSTAHIGDDT